MAGDRANWNDCLDWVAMTDVGRRRANNQDAHTVVLAGDEHDWEARGHLFVVADGMGAHVAGELASKIAVDGIPHLYHKYADRSPPEALQKSIIETNAEVYRRGQANTDFHNMGTTTSVLLLLPQGAFVAHVGDSRIYRLREHSFDQLTFDHSLVWEMRAAGQLPEGGDLARAIPKNVITRSLGPNPRVDVDIEGPFPVRVGDVFLLCSDGLTGQIEDDEIGALLATLAPHEAAQALIDLANLRGGPDNITIIAVKVTSETMATVDGVSEPIMIGGQASPPGVHFAWWIAATVLVLAALVMVVVQQFLAAGICAFASILTVLTALVWRLRNQTRGVSLSEGRRLGRGPYTRTDCTPKKDLAENLSATARELRSAAQERELDVDFAEWDRLSGEAEEAQKTGQFEVATSRYARLISQMMKDLRSRNNRHESDSTIDY